MTKEQYRISRRNNNIAWKRLKACGAIPNNGKKYEYVLHHWDESLRHNNIDRYIQWNLYDIEVLTNQEHSRLHGSNMTNEIRKKISKSLKGKPFSKEHCRKISEALKGKRYPMTGKHLLGKHLSDEHKKKISEARKLYWSRKHAQQIF